MSDYMTVFGCTPQNHSIDPFKQSLDRISKQMKEGK